MPSVTVASHAFYKSIYPCFQDGDGKLTLAEFVHHLYGDTKNVAEWDSAGLQFRTFRDHNKDGVIDKDELMLWIHP